MSADGKPLIRIWHVEEHGHVIAQCPGCGRKGTLPRGVFTVLTDGSVTPSFDCPHCAFHAWVRLENWPAAER